MKALFTNLKLCVFAIWNLYYSNKNESVSIIWSSGIILTFIFNILFKNYFYSKVVNIVFNNILDLVNVILFLLLLKD
jgi:hypothetical protein